MQSVGGHSPSQCGVRITRPDPFVTSRHETLARAGSLHPARQSSAANDLQERRAVTANNIQMTRIATGGGRWR